MKSLPEILKEIRPEFDFTASNDFMADGMLDSFAAIKAAHFGNQFYLSCSWFRFGYSTFTGPDGPEYKLCMLRRPKKYFEVE